MPADTVWHLNACIEKSAQLAHHITELLVTMLPSAPRTTPYVKYKRTLPITIILQLESKQVQYQKRWGTSAMIAQSATYQLHRFCSHWPTRLFRLQWLRPHQSTCKHLSLLFLGSIHNSGPQPAWSWIKAYKGTCNTYSIVLIVVHT